MPKPDRWKPVAVLTLYGAADMSPQRRQSVYRWLVKQGCALVDDGKTYGPRMRARYLVEEKA